MLIILGIDGAKGGLREVHAPRPRGRCRRSFARQGLVGLRQADLADPERESRGDGCMRSRLTIAIAMVA